MEMEAASPVCAVKVGQIGRVTEVWDNHFSFPFMCRTEGGHMIKHTNKSILSLHSVHQNIVGVFLWAEYYIEILIIVTDRRNSRQGLRYICIKWTGDINIWWWIYLNAALQKNYHNPANTRIKSSGGPLSALTCCVNARLLSAIKKISPLIYSQSWVGSWVYTTQAMMTFTLIF